MLIICELVSYSNIKSGCDFSGALSQDSTKIALRMLYVKREFTKNYGEENNRRRVVKIYGYFRGQEISIVRFERMLELPISEE